MFHIVLRHKNAPQLMQNQWLDDSCPAWITATQEIGLRCEESAKQQMPVRVHRTEWSGQPARVCCECEVAAVRPIDEHQVHIEFKNWRVLELSPLVRVVRGQPAYEI